MKKILVGEKFHQLTVLRDSPIPITLRTSPDGKRPKNRYLLCKCTCGRKTSVRADHLKAGKVKSCGCLIQETSFQKTFAALVHNKAEQNEQLSIHTALVEKSISRSEEIDSQLQELAAAPKPTPQEARFGLSPGQYAQMLAAQSGACAICERPPIRRALAVDHCHATGQVRGLLCHQCNQALGLFQDDLPRMSRAILYLAEFK